MFCDVISPGSQKEDQFIHGQAGTYIMSLFYQNIWAHIENHRKTLPTLKILGESTSVKDVWSA